MRRVLTVLAVSFFALGLLPSALEAQQRPPGGGEAPMGEPCGEGCEPGGDQMPPDVFFTPGGPVFTAQPVIQITWCDNHSLDVTTRQVKVNGVSQYSAFGMSYPGDCMAATAVMTATTVQLTMGLNTVWVSMCDYSSNCTQETFYITRQEGPPPVVSLAPHNPDLVDYGRCALSCFAATYAQSTVPFFTMDTPRSLTLAYNSATVDPKPFVHVDVRHGTDSAQTLPQRYVFKIKHGSSYQNTITFLNGETELRFAVPDTSTLRLGGQFDASQLGGTGVYPIMVSVGAQYDSTYHETAALTRLIVVDNSTSYIARGWSVAELQRLHVQTDGSVLIVHGDGSAVHFQKSGSSYITPNGEFSRLTNPGNGYNRVYYADSSRVYFGSTGNMDRIADRFGNNTWFFYDGSNRLYQVREPSPALINQTLNYGSNGLSSISALSRTTSVTVGAGRQLTAITDPDNVSTSFGYFTSADSLLQTITNRAGATTTLGYHASFRQLDSVTSPSVPIYGEGTIPLIARQTGWQRYGVPTGATSGTPATAPRADTVRATVTDAGGHSARMRLDRFGQVVQSSAPHGDTVTVTSNVYGLPTQVVDRLGITSSATFEASGFMTSATAGGVTMSARKSGFAQFADSTWGQGQAQRLFINTSNGRVDSTRVGAYYNQPAAAQSITRYTYNTRGQLTDARDNDANPGDLLAKRWYDSWMLNLEKDSAASSVATTYHQDSYGRTDQVTVTGLPVRSTVYDVLNRPIRQYDGVNTSPTEYFYGPMTLDSIRDPKGQVYRFLYNALGWRTAAIDPVPDTAYTYYNRDGLVARQENRRGTQFVTTAYDSLHRVTARNGSITDAAFTYYGRDSIRAANGEATVVTFLNPVHRQPDSVRTTLPTFGGGQQSYTQRNTYTAQAWLQSVAFYRAGGLFLEGREYRWRANVGVLDSLRFGASPWTRFTYNPGLQAIVTRFSASDSISRAFTEGHGMTDVRSPALWENYGYTALGQLNLAMTYSTQYRRQFAYDSLGHLRSTAFAPSPYCYYGYGFGHYCTGAADSTHSFSYDQVGNRLDHGGSYTPGNRITQFNSCTYGTDHEGADTLRTCGGVPAAFTWDADNRLTSYSVGGSTYSFGYDPLGRLVRRSVNGAIKSLFLWEGDNLAAELDSAGTSRVGEYMYYPGGLDNLYAMRVGTNHYFAHSDALGNVRALTNGTGTLKRTYNYDEWGQLYSSSQDLAGLNGNDRARFKGAVWMGPELDLYYMRNRWYEPRTGRFISEDPIGLQGGINQYAFGGSDPINSSDPSGLDFRCITAGGYWVYGVYPENPEIQHHRTYTRGGTFCYSTSASVPAQPPGKSAPAGGGPGGPMSATDQQQLGQAMKRACTNQILSLTGTVVFELVGARLWVNLGRAAISNVRMANAALGSHYGGATANATTFARDLGRTLLSGRFWGGVSGQGAFTGYTAAANVLTDSDHTDPVVLLGYAPLPGASLVSSTIQSARACF